MAPIKSVSVALALVAAANAHIAAWGKGMFCRNGLNHEDTPNIYYPVEPLVSLKYRDWFLHGECRNFPPPEGEFLNLPAGGTFTVEMAGSRAFTTLSYNGTKTSDWPDGLDHPEGYGNQHPDPRYPLNENGCISSPNLHCKNEQDAAGTAFAIAYESDINKVNIEDFVVFTTLAHTPYKRIATYHVPKLLPKCPTGGCLCAWGWVPNGCGQANEYFLPYRCQVTNVSPNARPLAKPKKPTWCEGQPSKCTKGAKMMSIGNQAERNTVDAGRRFTQADGQWAFYTYSTRLGWSNGAQEDIYEPASSSGGNDDNEDPPKTTVTPPKPSSEPPKAPTSISKPTSTSTPVPPKTDEDEEVHTTAPSSTLPKPTAHTQTRPSSSPKPPPSSSSSRSSSTSNSQSPSSSIPSEPTTTRSTSSSAPSTVTTRPTTESEPVPKPEPTRHDPEPSSEPESSSEPEPTPTASKPAIQPPSNDGVNHGIQPEPINQAPPPTSSPAASFAPSKPSSSSSSSYSHSSSSEEPEETKTVQPPVNVAVPNTDQAEPTKQVEPTKQPAFDPSSSSSQGANVAPTPSATASSKHCRVHRGGSSLVKKAHRRRGALSFLEHFRH
jgi:hypothetical protein